MYQKTLAPIAVDHCVPNGILDIAEALTCGAVDLNALHDFGVPRGSVQACLDNAPKKEGLAWARALRRACPSQHLTSAHSKNFNPTRKASLS